MSREYLRNIERQYLDDLPVGKSIMDIEEKDLGVRKNKDNVLMWACNIRVRGQTKKKDIGPYRRYKYKLALESCSELRVMAADSSWADIEEHIASGELWYDYTC
jgi:hypothetical protein